MVSVCSASPLHPTPRRIRSPLLRFASSLFLPLQFHSKSGLRYLKLRIDSGYEEFAAVYEVRVEGKTIGGGSSSSSSGAGDRD